MTKSNRQNLSLKLGVWLAAEVWLNIIGLDDIADYSEFIFAYNLDLNLNVKHHKTVKAIENLPQFCSQIDDFCPIAITDLERNDLIVKVEIFKNKCQKLAKPCLKSLCLPSIYSS